jgi:hypothetical protein
MRLHASCYRAESSAVAASVNSLHCNLLCVVRFGWRTLGYVVNDSKVSLGSCSTRQRSTLQHVMCVWTRALLDSNAAWKLMVVWCTVTCDTCVCYM